MKVRCEIKGLDCPHCAQKLERIYQDQFAGAALNYTMGTLVIETGADADEDEVVHRAQQIATAFEEGIAVSLRD